MEGEELKLDLLRKHEVKVGCLERHLHLRDRLAHQLSGSTAGRFSLQYHAADPADPAGFPIPSVFRRHFQLFLQVSCRPLAPGLSSRLLRQ